MRVANKLLFLYSLGLSFFVVLSGLLNSSNLVGSLILVPMPLYFLVSLAQRKADETIPKVGKGYWVTGLIFLVLLGMGVYNISSAKETTGANSPFSPIVVSKVSNPKTEVEVVVDNEPVVIKLTPNEDSKTLETVAETRTFKSVGREDKWYKVLLDDGSLGWINEQFIYEILAK